MQTQDHDVLSVGTDTGVYLARKGAVVFATNWMLLPLNLLTSVLVVHTVGAEGKGILVLLQNSVQLLASLGQFGTSVAAVYYLRQGKFNVRQLISNYLLLIMGVCIVALLLAFAGGEHFLSWFFEGSSLSGVILATAAVLLPITMLSDYLSALLLGLGHSTTYSYAKLAAPILYLVAVCILVIVFRQGVTGVLASYMLSRFLVVTYMWLQLWRHAQGQHCRPSLAGLTVLINYGIRHWIGTVGSLVFKRADSFLLSYFLDVSAVGYYSIALVFYNAVLSIPRAITTLLAGEASDKANSHPALLVAQVARNVLWIMIGVAIALALVSPWLIPRLYGPDFIQAIHPLFILMPAAVLMGFASVLYIFFMSTGRPGIGGIITLISGIVNLALSVLLIPIIGLVGSALGTLGGTGVAAGLYLVLFSHVSTLRFQYAVLLTRQDMYMWVQQSLGRLRRIVGVLGI